MENTDILGSSATHSLPYAVRFFEMVCVENTATERILSQLYPAGPMCASCGAMITGDRALKTFWRGERTFCSACGCKFSPRSRTILDGSHLTYAQFEVICVLLSLGIDHQRIAAMTKTHVDTVAAWHAKIKFWESHV